MHTLDTGTEDLLAELRGEEEARIAILTLNRPQRRNALSTAMLSALATTLELCERRSDVRCIIVTGSGPAFCAGGDVKGMAERQTADASDSGFAAQLATQRAAQRNTVGRIYRMPKPVIAALPGAAAGAGMGLCLACDLRIAADTAVMTTAFARVGFSGDFGLPWLLARQLGRAKALELLYLSDKLSAAQCLGMGLVNQVVPADRLMSAAVALAERLASGPSVAYGSMKENVTAAPEHELEPYMDGEVMRHLSAGLTEDHREAVRAFVEKREPRFRGR